MEQKKTVWKPKLRHKDTNLKPPKVEQPQKGKLSYRRIKKVEVEIES